MINFQKVSKVYPNQIFALREASFSIDSNEFVCIVGKSGAGKTTLLKLLLAIEKPTDGRIFFEGTDVSQISNDQVCDLRREIGVVFQDYKLIPSKTVYENISYVMELTEKSENVISKEIPQILEIVGMGDKANKFPHQLSGGEQQRAAIARAIAHRPKVVLADEPTGNLDPYHTQAIVSLLKRINKLGNTVVLATHDKEVIDGLKERVITLEDGRVIRDEKKGRFIL